MVVDASSAYTINELLLARKQMEPSRILVISPADTSFPIDMAGMRVVQRPDIASADPEEFLNWLRQWFATAEQLYAPTLMDEPSRLLEAGEYRAAVIAAITLLESTLRKRLKNIQPSHSRLATLKVLLAEAQNQNLLNNVSEQTALRWLGFRNQVVHSRLAVSRSQATEIVRGVAAIIAVR